MSTTDENLSAEERAAMADAASKAFDHPPTDLTLPLRSTEEMIRDLAAVSAYRMSGEETPDGTPWETLERVQQLRMALHGVGRVGVHLDGRGEPVGDQIQIVLTGHEAEALIMQMTGKVRLRQ